MAVHYFSLRRGNNNDRDWLFSLYSQCLKPAIEQTWGWDDNFQTVNFNQHLLAEKFVILMIEKTNIGGFVLEERKDCDWLEMLLIDPAYQRRGIGSRLLRQLQNAANSKGKPLKLSVIKKNPVLLFYQKLGFQVESEDEAFYRMIWP
jgi:ribosomal protein S18 acetylase RimI-like enzyme